MKGGALLRTGPWDPTVLGRSLPIERQLANWRRALAAVAALLLLWFGLLAWRAQSPEPSDPLSPKQTEELVIERLAAIEIPTWNPGEPLSEVPRPGFHRPPPPGRWRESLAGDPLTPSARELTAQAGRHFDRREHVEAATLYLRAADVAEGAWSPRYHAGLALLERGDYRAAARALDAAEDRLDRLPAGRTDGLAARIATLYAAGLAHQPDDCLEAIRRFKFSVAGLRSYVEAGGYLVYDRALPFPVRPAGFDSHSPWLALVEAYESCDDYPAGYAERFGGEVRGFLESEGYSAAAKTGDRVTGGAFPAELARCIEAAAGGEPPARCWAISNLNTLYYASRSAMPRAPGDVERTQQPDALARLAYDTAWLAGQLEDDRRHATTYLAQARWLNRRAEVDGLAEKIVALGRHLAPVTGDYSALAEPYVGVPAERLRLDERTGPEALKGIAWHLSERWQELLAAGLPDEMAQSIETQVQWAGGYGDSLRDWRRTVERRLQEALIVALRDARANGNLAVADALRRFRAPYLGDDWPGRVGRAWLRPGLWLGWFALWLLAVLGLWALYRLTVYPYLLYTADFYRLEFQRRHREAQAANRPYTRPEIERARRGLG